MYNYKLYLHVQHDKQALTQMSFAKIANWIKSTLYVRIVVYVENCVNNIDFSFCSILYIVLATYQMISWFNLLTLLCHW